jgi:hypothetical protein
MKVIIMNEINLLKQASLADKMGNYRLADNLFNSAYRYAQAPAAAEAAAKALEEVIAKIGIESAERAALEAGEKTIAEALAKDGGVKLLQFLEMKGIAAASAAKAGDEAAIRNLVESAGYTGRALEKQVAAIKGAPSEEAAKELSKALAARIKLRVMAGKGLPKPLLKLPEGVTKIYDSVKGVAEWAKGSKIGTKWLDLMLKYPAASKILKGLGYTYVATKAGSFLLNTITGEILDPAKIYDKIVSMIPSFTPGTPESTLPGSGSDINIEDEDGEDEDGTAGTPDPTTAPGFQYKTKEEMFERRMKTTPNQQTMKGSKPQEFVDANKGKYKTQREFYDAAFAAEDKNFANSVIALVKKDLDLPVSAQDPRKF